MKVSQPKDSGSFTPAPEGVHQAVLIRFLDKGTHYVERWEKWQRQLMVTWELVDERMDDGKPFVVTQNYTASFHEKSKLRQHLESMRGKRFTEKELQGFDLDTLLGANCMVQIIHNVDNQDRTWANVTALMPLPKGLKSSDATACANDLYSFDTTNPNMDIFESLSDGMKEYISESTEFVERFGSSQASVEPKQKSKAKGGRWTAQAEAAEDFDDDIPF